MTAIPSRRFPENEMKLIRNMKKDSIITTAVVRCFNCWAKSSIVENVVFMILGNNTLNSVSMLSVKNCAETRRAKRLIVSRLYALSIITLTCITPMQE